jgi:y4mF family transcriptional regulator
MWAQSPAEIGRIVVAARRHRGLTQAGLARAAGVTQAWISQVEQGKDNAQIGKVLRLLSYLGVRLRVGEAPWEKSGTAEEASSGILAQVLSSLSDEAPPHGRKGRKK